MNNIIVKPRKNIFKNNRLVLINFLIFTVFFTSCGKDEDKRIAIEKQKQEDAKISSNENAKKGKEAVSGNSEGYDSSLTRDSSRNQKESMRDEQITFVCRKMPYQSGESKAVSNAKGRIDFKLFYHRGACEDYDYSFKKSNDTLIIYHSDEPMSCMKYRVFYHAEGYIEGLSPGRYTFTVIETARNITYISELFTTLVTVK